MNIRLLNDEFFENFDSINSVHNITIPVSFVRTTNQESRDKKSE